MIMTSVDRAVERVKKIKDYHVSPFRCYYFNPNRYTPVQLMKWMQKYVQNRMYMTLLNAMQIVGYEVVPAELVLRNARRDGYSKRKMKIGSLTFYLLKEEEMTKGLLQRYLYFKEKMTR